MYEIVNSINSGDYVRV